MINPELRNEETECYSFGQVIEINRSEAKEIVAAESPNRRHLLLLLSSPSPKAGLATPRSCSESHPFWGLSLTKGRAWAAGIGPSPSLIRTITTSNRLLHRFRNWTGQGIYATGLLVQPIVSIKGMLIQIIKNFTLTLLLRKGRS